ncbi:MAG: radical SAM protein [Verrucomicrobiota bacterium]|nr:radical SAM protein [Verrucomicrobiota bacterium]
MKDKTLTVNEIYYSVQGESTWAGLPCVFIRLTFCNLRCTYCDTAYAFYDGEKTSIPDILDKVKSFNCSLVELTGGEPLLQPGSLVLMTSLCDAGFTVLLETSGSLDIGGVDKRVHVILDLKCPGSGEVSKNLYSNIDHLEKKDEVKFVIADRIDYEWARDQVLEHALATKAGTVLFSPVFGRVDPSDIVSWILKDHLPVRFQIQMHKIIWDPLKKGV